MRMRLAGIAAGAALWATPALAQDRLHGLQTADDAAGWEAVGRLDIDGKGFCTGALIAPDLVLTAAHCLFDRETGAPVDAVAHRVPGGAPQRAGAGLPRRARAPCRIPTTASTPTPAPPRAATTSPSLELDQPIRSTQVVPFETAAAVHDGGRGRRRLLRRRTAPRSPSLQDVCGVLGEEAGVLVMDCDVDFGSSGAPVFQIEGGVARIVSVVSAKGELGRARRWRWAPRSPSRWPNCARPSRPRRAPAAAAGPDAGPSERAETGAKFVRRRLIVGPRGRVLNGRARLPI